jgi:Arc/MetJ family transcription regulator
MAGNEMGRIKPGYLADVILADGNPIANLKIPQDATLIREAMKLANVKTKREAVDLALRRFVHSGKQKRLLDLHGSGGIRKNYDYKQARSAG